MSDVVFKMYNEYVVDLEDESWDILPEGWQYVLVNNCYTGWGSSDGIRFAIVEPVD